MTRAEIEKVIEPIIHKSLRELEYTREDVADADFARHTDGMFRPDVRRVSLLVQMAKTALGAGAGGQALELGSGFGYLLFPMAVLLTPMRWTGVDHPERSYRHPAAYQKAYQEYRCAFEAVDICRQPLPFPDAHFSLVTFSEVLEHLPMERVNFVFMEMTRVIRKGGVLLVSSPNQASLENRLRLLRGKSILDLPNGSEAGKVFGHIRLYTRAEVATAISRLGFVLEQSRMETNISGFRGSAGSWRRRMYRWYEKVEQRLGVLQGMADTWYMAFRRT